MIPLSAFLYNEIEFKTKSYIYKKSATTKSQSAKYKMQSSINISTHFILLYAALVGYNEKCNLTKPPEKRPISARCTDRYQLL
jgi:hypothetical protein